MPVNKKLMKSLKEEYGSDKGEAIYYAMENKRKKKAVGGETHTMPDGTVMPGATHEEAMAMAVPPEMNDMEAPVDTYPNIPPEEMDEALASQLPDEEMVGNYIQYVVDESLTDNEKNYLMKSLEADPRLSTIFDKIVETASEFTGAGEVSGPGTGVSDSIPARLSDGEFVFTRKATDQLGADNLQKMMDDAERAYDGGLMQQDQTKMQDIQPSETEEVKSLMMSANRMPSLKK